MWNRLISVVEEQAQALVRTAFSTSVREAGRFVGWRLRHARANMLAQAVTGTPGHVNAMADAVAHFIRRIGPAEHATRATFTSPTTPGKAPGICTISPSSVRLFARVSWSGFFACTAHIVDIGGRGFGADGAQSIYEEGLVYSDHEIRRPRRRRPDAYPPHRQR